METYRERLCEAIEARKNGNAAPYRASMEALGKSIAGIKARINMLRVFPIKSLGGVSAQDALVTSEGLALNGGLFLDRSAMLVIEEPGTTAHGTPFTHRRFSIRDDAALACVRAEIDHDALKYVSPTVGAQPLTIRAKQLEPRNGDQLKIKIVGDEVVDGVFEDGEMTQWVRGYLLDRGNPARNRYNVNNVHVVLPPKNFRRPVADSLRGERPAHTRFSDGGQVLLGSQSTYDWLSQRIAEVGGPHIPAEVFRANIVIGASNGTTLPPNIEDVVASANIVTPRRRGSPAETSVDFADLCVRCPVTTVNPETGERFGTEPLSTLARVRPPRPDKPASVTIDVNCTLKPEPGRTIRVGDEVTFCTEKQ